MDLRHARVLAEAAYAAGSADPIDAAQMVLSVLRPVVGHDASSLIMWDGSTRTHLALAADGYDDQVLTALGDPYADDHVHRPLRDSGRATRIVDMPQEYLDTDIYRKVAGAAGFGDGMSMFLTSEEHGHVGMLHLSAASRGTFDGHAAELVTALRPAIARMCDAMALRHPTHPTADVTTAHLLDASGRMWHVDGSDDRSVIESQGFRAVVDAFLRSTVMSARGTWPVGEGWTSVELTRARHPFDRSTPLALVRLRPSDQLMGLSSRELDILNGMARGHSNAEIAEARWLSPRTVTTHVEHILAKTGQRSRAGAVSAALRMGIVGLSADDF